MGTYLQQTAPVVSHGKQQSGSGDDSDFDLNDDVTTLLGREHCHPG